MSHLGPINRRIFRTKPDVDDVYTAFHRWSLRVIIIGGIAVLVCGLLKADYSKQDRTKCQEYDLGNTPLLNGHGARVCRSFDEAEQGEAWPGAATAGQGGVRACLA